MTPARPLREVFAGLDGRTATGPAELLAAHGHPDLPDDLVAEAVVSYADTAPAEVAEHLAPFVMANSPVPTEPAADSPSWFDLLSTVPPVPDGGDAELEISDVDSLNETDEVDFGADPGAGLDFGAGSTETDLAEPTAEESGGLPDELAMSSAPSARPDAGLDQDWDCGEPADQLPAPDDAGPADPADLFD